ncbi:TetR/AcrR family transcriptional regulator [Nocardioides seonyuensis]|uniref:TetR/AcrR family transcriptional regulator n=1 Tax=Nocardioides seonyuensis TaxID=2518371 RepID=A0A4P7IBA1_9ACTN|nr:TetR/AcrR family transcriptional regulator [Nocardioides seonyuensis]QBX54286.1 TetR/AcrR family transcriptional regulator [Nocardioides seonyuensis]
MTPEQAATRPRVEGDREAEILDATIEVLVEVGYDRLTMDAVAQTAKASKATLYRRWESKPALVFDAVCSRKVAHPEPDTGSLRQDLIEAYCGVGAFGDSQAPAVLAAVVTAMSRDEEFAETYRRDFIGPKIEVSRRIYQRAIERGEIPPHVDVDLLAPAAAGIVLHRVFLLGETPDADLIARVVDHLILPAARAAVPAP